MANQEQLEILKQGVDVWNKWRDQYPSTRVDLSGAELIGSNLRHVHLMNARLTETNLSRARLEGAVLAKAWLDGARFTNATIRGANLYKAEIREASFAGADLDNASLQKAFVSKSNFVDATLREANLAEAQLVELFLDRADLSGTNLSKSNLTKSVLDHALLTGANLAGATLYLASLYRARLMNANLGGTDLRFANLKEADFRGANLQGANLLGAHIDRANISGSSVYGINVWDISGEFAQQKDLVITRDGQESVTVDNVKVAQFIYLILNNQEIRHVIDTLTSKSVLILGRFGIPERKAILDALRDQLRRNNLLPIVFDFERPTDRDFTETINTLAGLSYFVIADITNPKSSPLELQAAVPDYQIPFVPIIQEGEAPFSMLVDLQKKYDWVLNTISYDSLETLMKVLKPLVIGPALRKRQELRMIKARTPEIVSAKDFLAKDGS